jgi:hypothetical protein
MKIWIILKEFHTEFQKMQRGVFKRIFALSGKVGAYGKK